MASPIRPTLAGDMPDRIVHQYGNIHNLQTLSVWLPPSQRSSAATPQFWIVYIHGGAWCDPTITNTSFIPALDVLYHNPALTPHIAGYASIDYRLSASRSYPQDPSTTPASERRNARHPAHISDVCEALMFLQMKYGIRENYILTGHSCGATLAFQTIMGPGVLHGTAADGMPEVVSRPAAIVGVAGIYDLRGIRDRHREVQAYENFIKAAFGEDEQLWDRVSPARGGGFDKQWKEGKVVVLAHSNGDELVEEEQVLKMERLVRSWDGEKRLVCLKGDTALKGAHDEIWEKGLELARAITVAVEELIR